MTNTSIRKAIAWWLLATLALVSGVGEGLHWLPGMAHSIEMPGGCQCCTGCSPAQAEPRPDGEGLTARRQGGEWPLLLDEGDCAICRICSQSQSRAFAVHLTLAMLFVSDLPAVNLSDVPVATAQAFQARAPPLV